MQILGVVDEPKGIRLRYKTLQTIATVPKTTDAAPKPVRRIELPGNVKLIACSPDGKLIAVANGNPTFPLAQAGAIRGYPERRDGRDCHLAQAHHRRRRRRARRHEGLPHFEVEPLSVSPDGDVLAVGTGIGQVKLFDTRTGEMVRALDDEKAKLAETTTPKELKSLPRAMGSVTGLAFSFDGELLATCGPSFDDAAREWGDIERGGLWRHRSGRLNVWDVPTGRS